MKTKTKNARTWKALDYAELMALATHHFNIAEQANRWRTPISPKIERSMNREIGIAMMYSNEARLLIEQMKGKRGAA